MNQLRERETVYSLVS